MSLRLRRGLATLACRVLHAASPAGLRTWEQAISHEVAEIADDGDALLFALSGLGGLAPRIVASHLFCLFAALTGGEALAPGGTIDMRIHTSVIPRPRFVGIACAVAAAALGLVYMASAGAPMTYLAVNAGALVVGLVLLRLAELLIPRAATWPPGAFTLAMATVLPATALFGDQVDGAARWVRAGALALQPSLVLLPMMVVGFARSRDPLSTAGMIVAAAGLALQPDRAMAGLLVAGLLAVAITRPDRFALSALAGGIVAFTVTLTRRDALPAVPYVDHILYSSFNTDVLVGLAVLGGSVLLVVPAIVGWFDGGKDRVAYCAFGLVWSAATLAAALGNYPTPVVGYGGSAVVGYLLSLAMLPKLSRPALRVESADTDNTHGAERGRHFDGLYASGLAKTSVRHCIAG